jgi:hypothetical protein
MQLSACVQTEYSRNTGPQAFKEVMRCILGKHRKALVDYDMLLNLCLGLS